MKSSRKYNNPDSFLKSEYDKWNKIGEKMINSVTYTWPVNAYDDSVPQYL